MNNPCNEVQLPTQGKCKLGKRKLSERLIYPRPNNSEVVARAWGFIETLLPRTIERLEKQELWDKWKPRGMTRRDFDKFFKSGSIYDSDPYGSMTGNIFGIPNVLLPIIRRITPNLMAQNLISVQPMLTPSPPSMLNWIYHPSPFEEEEKGNPFDPDFGLDDFDPFPDFLKKDWKKPFRYIKKSIPTFKRKVKKTEDHSKNLEEKWSGIMSDTSGWTDDMAGRTAIMLENTSKHLENIEEDKISGLP